MVPASVDRAGRWFSATVTLADPTSDHPMTTPRGHARRHLEGTWTRGRQHTSNHTTRRRGGYRCTGTDRCVYSGVQAVPRYPRSPLYYQRTVCTLQGSCHPPLPREVGGLAPPGDAVSHPYHPPVRFPGRAKRVQTVHRYLRCPRYTGRRGAHGTDCTPVPPGRPYASTTHDPEPWSPRGPGRVTAWSPATDHTRG